MKKEEKEVQLSEVLKLALYIRKKYFEYKGNINNRVISPIKMQKSLYFLFAYWGQYIRNNKENPDSVEIDFSKYEEFLFDARIEAWTYGPVVPEVFIANKEGLLDEIEKKEFVDNLLEQLFEIDDFGLVRISHEDNCWKKYYVETDDKHEREIPKKEIIDEYISKSIKRNI